MSLFESCLLTKGVDLTHERYLICREKSRVFENEAKAETPTEVGCWNIRRDYWNRQVYSELTT
eukprot:UN04904